MSSPELCTTFGEVARNLESFTVGNQTYYLLGRGDYQVKV